MKLDRITKVILGAIALGLVLIATALAWDTMKPATADAASYSVRKFALCNAYLPAGTKPWCAEIVKLSGSEYSGGKIFVMATSDEK